MKLKKLYRMARAEQGVLRLLWDGNNLEHHSEIVRRRDAIMDAIFAHPDNVYSRAAISCQIIDGLSGAENELKN